MILSPHTLELFEEGKLVEDEFGREVEQDGKWVVIGECRCVDNNTQKHISVNGKDYTYSYNIIHEGNKIEAGSLIRVKERDVEGEVVASSKNNYFDYSQVWI